MSLSHPIEGKGKGEGLPCGYLLGHGHAAVGFVNAAAVLVATG